MDGNETTRVAHTGDALLISLLRLPSRAAFVAVALLQIGVELAVKVVRDAWT